MLLENTPAVRHLLVAKSNKLRNAIRPHVTEAILCLSPNRPEPNIDMARNRLREILRLCELEK